MPTFEDIAVLPPALDERVDGPGLFGNDGPLELEIGCGKGGFLLAQARAHPDRNYLGLEWANAYFKYAADRMARWGLGNVRIMRTDAKEFLLRQLADGSLAALHVYHPDPWPKKRHHKRRLFCPRFAKGIVRALRPGARLYVQTDHAEYFEVIQCVLDAERGLAPAPWTPDPPDRATPSTNYEVKYVREGRVIYRRAWCRP